MTYDLYMIKDQSITKNNVYLIVDKETNKVAIVDPGCSIRQINEFLIKYKLELNIILVTHTHFDHTRCVYELVNQYGCGVYVSRAEAEYYLYNCPNLFLFDDEDDIWVGNTRVKCFLTPGHTFGSACFLLENSLFTGDTIFIEGCGVCNTRGGSPESMFRSIAKIKQRVEDSTLIYPGHTYSNKPGKSVAYLKQYNIYFCIEEENKFIDFRMRKNQKNLFGFI